MSRGDIKIPVSEVKVGMFISRLDRDWIGTPFLFQGFFVRSVEEIELLSEYCNEVYVIVEGKNRFDETVDLKSSLIIGRKPVEYDISHSVSEVFKGAYDTAKTVKKFIKASFSKAEMKEVIDTAAARIFVSESVELVLKHPDAVAFMTRLRNQDDYTAEHCMNVCFLAVIFGRKLGLRKHQLVNLGLCGLLHDVGKARIPPEILNKPGRLTDDEFEIMRKHAEYGRDVLSQKRDAYEEAVFVAYSHHERPDGKGYPRGLPDGDISLFCKIISIVDVYDAITGDRVYARGRASSEALRILYENRGKQFDNNLTLAFIQTIGIYPPGVIVELVSGAVGIVVDSSGQYQHLPRIIQVLDEDKKPLDEPCAYDLIDTVEQGLSKKLLIKNTLPDGAYDIYLQKYVDSGIFEHLHATDEVSKVLDKKALDKNL
jgi:HD-GYP domain-containing protein (c-di-GMP phosphodiesterase class II)